MRNRERQREKNWGGERKKREQDVHLVENYRKVHPYDDSDSSEDEVDWQDTRHDPYRPRNLR
ncbi:hypothetical protein WMY93_034221 [Mugilogobius chulae]|uniref:Uncharacterized protein n=1 Tax=Mugilogobius chulae TaxID=88201 RepID=A0AAW0MG09_9GOBI